MMDKKTVIKLMRSSNAISQQIPGKKATNHFRSITKMVKIGSESVWSTLAGGLRNE